MNILVINAGSSSVKYQLMNMETEEVIAKGLAERIGIDGSNLQHKPTGKDPVTLMHPMEDHVAAMKLVFQALTDETHGVIASMDEIGAVGHRVLHGGDKFSESVIIDERVKEAIRDNIPLGPLHNPANLMGIEACEKVMPQTPQVAVFDTAFHQTMPPHAFMYALPQELYHRLKVRRYGFHGTSHKYISRRAIEFLKLDPYKSRVITCHLGNGCSMAAIQGGRCVDTSMGITPLEGMVMGTRSGDLDPAIVKYIMDNDEQTVDEVIDMLNKRSGLLGLSAFSSDMRDVLEKAQKGDENCELAVEVFCYRIKKYIGAYAATMGGVDAIVFTAGIGENNPYIRSRCLEGLDFLGVAIDEEKNALRGQDIDISAPEARVRTAVLATNEELVIARDTLDLVGV